MRPASIVNFERIVLLLIVFGLAGTVLRWDQLRTYAEQQGYGEGMLIAVQAVSIGVLLLLMWLIAHRRSVVAKWIYVVLCLAGLAIGIPALGEAVRGPMPALLLQAAQWVLTLLSVWMLFRPDAKAWFARGGAATAG